MKYLLLILALMIPQIALARIGETVKQCDERYGKSLGGERFAVGLDKKGYLKGPYIIIAYFVKGVCWQLVFNTEHLGALDTETAEAIVEKNMNKPTYKGQTNAASVWTTQDKTAIATLTKKEDSGDGRPDITLKIWHNNYDKGRFESKKNEAEKKVKGLGF